MNVASSAGYTLFAGAIPYSATKYFVTALTEGIAHELDRQGGEIRAQLLAPDPIATEFLQRSLQGTRMQNVDARGIKFHTPQEVAEFAMQLYDSDATAGIVQPDMTFQMAPGLHQAGWAFQARQSSVPERGV